MKRSFLLLVIVMGWMLLSAQASEVIKLDGISIQGHLEEPQVMYITPWQEPPGTGRLQQEAVSFREQWLHTIDSERLEYDLAMPEKFLRKHQNERETQQ